MITKITDTCISLEDGTETFTLLEKPVFPHFHDNVTKRPYISSYYEAGESIWAYCQASLETLADLCHDDPCFGCYAMIFRRLFPLLLSSGQAKNVISYGLPADHGACQVFRNFMSFLQEGNALTALPQSIFSFVSLNAHTGHAFLYYLDAFPSPAAVCDAICKVKPGGILILYTIKETLPAELTALCARAEKDSFSACTLYTLTVDETIMEYAHENGTEAFLLYRSAEITKRANDLQPLLQALLAGAALPDDARLIAAAILQQTEEILLSIYDFLENDELPIRANNLKEAILNYSVGINGSYDLTAYLEKLTQASETFFTAIQKEFS